MVVKVFLDNELNNRCDELARGAIVELRKTLPILEDAAEQV